MTLNSTYTVVFPDWYDDRAEWEAAQKGWLQGVEIRFSNGFVQSLLFYDPVRLAQDLEVDAKLGTPYIAHPGLIVIPEVTRQTILTALAKLVEADFFPASKRAG